MGRHKKCPVLKKEKHPVLEKANTERQGNDKVFDVCEDKKELTPRERQLAALKPHQWKPGQSGNPKGGPRKDVSITALVKKMLGEVVEGTDGKTHAQQVAEALVRGLKILDRTSIKQMLARIEGPIKQKIEIERPEPFTVEIVEEGPE